MARKLYEFIAPAQAGLSLMESENGKDLFLSGLFIQGVVENQNGRIYPRDEIARDVDDDDLTYSITGGDQITATLDGSDISFSAPADYNGSEEFSVSVSDGEYSDSESITVTVNAVNDVPVANATSGTTSEDQSVVITLSGSDIDGDALTFTLANDATNGSVLISGSVATYTPNQDFNGEDSFTFTVSDGDLSDDASVTLTVDAVNDAPVLATVSG